MKFEHQAKLVKRIRVRHNLTQRDLALAMGLPDTTASRQFVSNIERGENGFPVERVRRLWPYAPIVAFRTAYLRDYESHFEDATR